MQNQDFTAILQFYWNGNVAYNFVLDWNESIDYSIVKKIYLCNHMIEWFFVVVWCNFDTQYKVNTYTWIGGQIYLLSLILIKDRKRLPVKEVRPMIQYTIVSMQFMNRNSKDFIPITFINWAKSGFTWISCLVSNPVSVSSATVD